MVNFIFHVPGYHGPLFVTAKPKVKYFCKAAMLLYILQNTSATTFAYFLMIHCYKNLKILFQAPISFHVHYVVSTHHRKLKQKVDRNQMYTWEHAYTGKRLCNMPLIFCHVTVCSLLIRELETRLCVCEYDHTT
jgi:hypothetical protein